MKVSLTTAEKFLHGDENSFAAIYQAYKHLVFFLVRSLLVDQSLAEDCYQETFLKVWETRSNIKSPFAVEKYLLTTARRLAIQKNQ